MNQHNSHQEIFLAYFTNDEIRKAVCIYREILENCVNNSIEYEQNREIFINEFNKNPKSEELFNACKKAFSIIPSISNLIKVSRLDEKMQYQNSTNYSADEKDRQINEVIKILNACENLIK
jgi:hypothetical protein